MRTIPEILEAGAARTPGAPALLAVGRPPLAWRALRDLVAREGRALAGFGIGPRDPVAAVLPNGPEMAAAFLAISSAAPCAPLNPDYREAEFRFYLEDLSARALVVLEGAESPARRAAKDQGIRIHELRPDGAEAGRFVLAGARLAGPAAARECRPDDLALVLHTSGTTARPKRVPLTQANLAASAEAVAASLSLGPDDRCLNVMPLFHVHGLVAALLGSLGGGGGIVCSTGFRAGEFFEWLAEADPTWFSAVPAMHQAILARLEASGGAFPRGRLRFIRSCSAALPPTVGAGLERAFGVPVLEAYGMTEAAHQMASNPLPPRPRKAGSVGVAAGAEIAIRGEGGEFLGANRTGEIVIRGPGVTPGYLNQPEANAASFADGWFRTGDQGRLDGEGYLFLTGRLKELINRGGEKIAPREVDESLLLHPAVAQAVAFAMPDERLGEEVAAAVVLRPGASATEFELQAHVAARLADFKVPQRILFVEEIPKGPTGKPRRVGLASVLGLAGAGPQRVAEARAFVEARTPVEEALAALWRRVLRVERVGVHDRFLDLGGDSLLAGTLLARVREALDVSIPLWAFFGAPTVAEQARRVEEALLSKERGPA